MPNEDFEQGREPELQQQTEELIRRNEILMLENLNNIAEVPGNSVIILGPTGFGKSTFATCLAGRELTAQLEEDLLVLDSPNPIPGIVIGHDRSSATLMPRSWRMNDDTNCWDCPGFYENRGGEYEIASAFFIKKLLGLSRACKFLFIVSSALFNRANDTRYTGFKRALADLDVILQSTDNIQETKPGLMLVVSMANQDQTEENIREQIRGILDNDRSRLPISQKEILDAFASNPIIIFKKPITEGVYEYNHQEYLRKIDHLQFVSTPNVPINSLINATTRGNITVMYDGLSLSINQYIDDFIDHLDTQLKHLIDESVANSNTEQLKTALAGLKSIPLTDDNGMNLSNHELLSKTVKKCADLEINRAIAPQTLNLINSLNLKKIKHKIGMFEFLEQFVGPESRKSLKIKDAIERYFSNIKDIELQISLLTPKIVHRTVYVSQPSGGGGGGKCTIM